MNVGSGSQVEEGYQSERRTQLCCIWNLEKQYRCIYLQSRNRDADIERVYEHQGGKREWDGLGDGDWRMGIYTTVYKIGNY